MKDRFEEIHELLALKKYEQVLEMLYDSSANNVREDYRSDVNHAWYIIGDIFFKRGEFDKAVNAFKNAIDSWGEDVDAMLALANSYSELKQFPLAEDVLLLALKLQPNNAALIYNLGNAFFDQGEFDQALKAYSKIDKNSDGNIFELAQKNIKAIRKNK